VLSTLAVASPRSTTTRILVVDDEPDIREAVRDVLEASLDGASVVTADGGRQALEILSRGHVDLILTDYKMPGMNGVQFLDAAERVAPGTAHILVTAFDRELVGALGGRADKESILQKPVDPDRLLREVERALRRIGH
jgi:two-component system, NtrC family, nitrogen regulation response regulator NtrX